MHQGVWREVFGRCCSTVALAFAGAHQMRLAASQSCGLCIPQGIAHRMHLVQSHPETLTDLLEQSGQGFSALAVVLRQVRTKENGIHTAASNSEQFIHFVVHEPGDVVGVVVVEGVKAGTDLTGWVMDGDSTVTIKSESDIPIGHKIALQDLKTGDTIIKYGVDIGKVVAPIKKGEHTHVQNVKTKRW